MGTAKVLAADQPDSFGIAKAACSSHSALMRFPHALCALVCTVVGAVAASTIGCASESVPASFADAQPPLDALPKQDARDNDTGLADASATDASGVLIDARNDACAPGTDATKSGETCVGFGTGTPCETSCGLPQYGYVCAAGGPPNLMGCKEVRRTSFGNTYCCPDFACVEQPDQARMCGAGEKRFQCAVDPQGGPLTTPAAGCKEDRGAAISGSRFYCCP
jgi:hypothetical protein